MAVSKELICPMCKKNHSLLGGGLLHDEKLNLICSECKGIMFAVEESAENKLKNLLWQNATAGVLTSPYYAAATNKKEPLPIKASSVDFGATCCEENTEPIPPVTQEDEELFI